MRNHGLNQAAAFVLAWRASFLQTSGNFAESRTMFGSDKCGAQMDSYVSCVADLPKPVTLFLGVLVICRLVVVRHFFHRLIAQLCSR